MPTIRLGAATHRALAAAAVLPFRATGVRQADGTWRVPLDEHTYAHLQAARRPGESEDDTVTRLLQEHGAPQKT